MEKIILPVVIGVVKDDEGRILFGKRNQPQYPQSHGKWNLLGGRIEFGETPEEAIVREMKEESGLDVEVIKLVPQIFTRYHNNSDGKFIQILPCSYYCKIVGGELHDPPQDPGVSELKFVDHTTMNPDELIDPTELSIIELALS